MLNLISVSGYGWSGSSACIDILKEFEGFEALEGEFRIAKDPYGLADLEESLVRNWDFIRHDVAIKDFLNYCKVLSRGTGLFRKVGKNFSNKLNIDFMLESEAYIANLADMSYFGDTSVYRYNIPAYSNFIMKLRSKLGKANGNYMHFARPNEDDFIKKTRSYINSLFKFYENCITTNTLILDQAIPPTNIINTSKYFENIKIIIIDRDPRDIYVNLVKNNVLIGADLKNCDSAKKYIKWHNTLRNNKVCNDNSQKILRLNFEDLVGDYEQSIDKIIRFLGGDLIHKNKYSFFNPNSLRAAGNVGLWKKYKDQVVMGEIHKELEMYCYNS
jgi:hypothetical protein